MKYKFFNFPVFMISLAVGLLFVYLIEPTPRAIFVYPTPKNVDEIEYIDTVGNCFKYNSNLVDCPKEKSLIQTIPIQD